MAADAASTTPDSLMNAPPSASDTAQSPGADERQAEPLAPEAQRSESPLAPPTAPPGMRKGRSRRRLIIGGVCVLAALAMLAGLAAILANRPPSWWSPSDPNDPRVIARAQIIENGAATQLTKIRQAEASGEIGANSKPWTVSISADDANAWLASRLPKWLESQAADAKSAGGGSGTKPFVWPKELGQVQVRFADGAIWIGAAVKANGLSGKPQILSASIDPLLRDDGSLWLPARLVSLGSLNLPASWTLSSTRDTKAMKLAEVPEHLRDLPQTKDLLNVLTGQMPAMRRPIIKIGDGRRVKLLNIESRDGVLLITCQTMAREKR